MSTSVKQIEELQNILVAESEAYQQLITLTQAERSALQKEDLDNLTSVTQEKQELLEKVSAWEQVRATIMAHLANEFGLPPDVSLLDLITHMDESVADTLSDIRNEFIQLVEQLLTLNHGNQLMLQTGLVRIESTFDYLSTIAAPRNSSYSANGNSATPTRQQASGNMLNWQA
jgi:flagellar biosynthesis/type III secretory pathway chaperone